VSPATPRDRWSWSTTPGRPALRIGDAEREDAVNALGEHFATGRLSREEYDDRAEAVLRARTAQEVAPLFGDLPAPHPMVLTGAPWGAASRVPAQAQGRGATPKRSAPHVPWVPIFLIVLGTVLLLDAPGALLVVLAGLWWLSMSVRWRRARQQWATRWGGPGGPHGFSGHRHRC
jgi:hypothetical protein